MNVLVVWEWIINLVALFVAVQVYRGGRFWSIVSDRFYRVNTIGTVLAFLVVYLLTMLLFGVLTGGIDLNYSGDDGIFDPWNSVFDWTPIMKWWMWLLLIVGLVCYFISVKRPEGWTQATQVFGGALLILAVLGMQWNNPFVKPPTVVAARDCTTILREFDSVWNQEQDLFKLQRSDVPDTDLARQHEVAVSVLGIQKERLKAEFGGNNWCIQDVEVRIVTPARVDGRTVHVVATVLSGQYLTFEWLTHDPSHPDYVVTDGTEGSVLDYTYSSGTRPGQYPISLKVSNYFDRSSTDTTIVTLN